MAKKVWDVDAKTGTLIRLYDDATVADLTLNVTDLFADYLKMEEVQQLTIINGIKQKIADTIAVKTEAALTESEKREKQDTLWKRMINDREFNLPGGGGTRGPSVSLKTLVPALIQAGLDESAIATATGKSVEVIVRFLETGEE